MNEISDEMMKAMFDISSQLDGDIKRAIEDWKDTYEKQYDQEFMLSCMLSVLTTILSTFTDLLKKEGYGEIKDKVIEILSKHNQYTDQKEDLQ